MKRRSFMAALLASTVAPIIRLPFPVKVSKYSRWVNISDGILDPNAPITSGMVYHFKDNPMAITGYKE